jgi:DNA-binding transcriptional regulator YbjK
LLRAALDVLADGGAKAVTHRAVAARAGLPPASTTYYFESIQQLTQEALRLHVSERVGDFESLLASALSANESAEQVARQFAYLLTTRPTPAVIAQFEVYLEAARTPSLRQVVADALDAFERVAELALGELGARRPKECAAVFVAMLDGFALHRVARQRSTEEDVAVLLNAMRSVFIAYVMDDDERARWDERIAQNLRLT